MKLEEALDLRGRLTMQKRDAQGVVIDTLRFNNSIVLSGRDLVAKLFVHQTIDPVSHVAIGTGNAAVQPGDTALGGEVFRKAIKAVDPSQDITTTNESKRKVILTAELDFTEGNAALTEAGLFNAVSGGVMYNRVVFPPINKTADFKLTLIWEIIF